jgi:hypothetical protein
MGSSFKTVADLPNSESAHAYALLGGSTGSPSTGRVVWHTSGEAVDAPGVRTEVAGMLARVAALPGVTAVANPHIAGSTATKVIATAAVIMLCVFASFGFSGQRIVSCIGIGLAFAVVVDAFVVRMVLVPALLRTIGGRVWAYPRWADRVTPRLAVEGPSDEGETKPHGSWSKPAVQVASAPAQA